MKKPSDRPTLKIELPTIKQTKHSGVELSAYLDGGPLTFFYWRSFVAKILDALLSGRNVSIVFVDNTSLETSSTYGKTVTKAAKGGKR